MVNIEKEGKTKTRMKIASKPTQNRMKREKPKRQVMLEMEKIETNQPTRRPRGREE